MTNSKFILLSQINKTKTYTKKTRKKRIYNPIIQSNQQQNENKNTGKTTA